MVNGKSLLLTRSMKQRAWSISPPRKNLPWNGSSIAWPLVERAPRGSPRTRGRTLRALRRMPRRTTQRQYHQAAGFYSAEEIPRAGLHLWGAAHASCAQRLGRREFPVAPADGAKGLHYFLPG